MDRHNACVRAGKEAVDRDAFDPNGTQATAKQIGELGGSVLGGRAGTYGSKVGGAVGSALGESIAAIGVFKSIYNACMESSK
jgi:hypothetical protein